MTLNQYTKAQNELGDAGVVCERESGLGVDDGDSGVRSDVVEVRTDTTVARDRGLNGEAERRDGLQGTDGVPVSVTQPVERANVQNEIGDEEPEGGGSEGVISDDDDDGDSGEAEEIAVEREGELTLTADAGNLSSRWIGFKSWSRNCSWTRR